MHPWRYTSQCHTWQLLLLDVTSEAFRSITHSMSCTDNWNASLYWCHWWTNVFIRCLLVELYHTVWCHCLSSIEQIIPQYVAGYKFINDKVTCSFVRIKWVMPLSKVKPNRRMSQITQIDSVKKKTNWRSLVSVWNGSFEIIFQMVFMYQRSV